MNYLAHLYFSDPDPLAWAGSLMGDFFKGPVPSSLVSPLRRHLILHRRIDTLTQQEENFQASRRRLDPRFRYARSVLVDVFYDHFLAQNWQRYHSQPLDDFSHQVYAGLAAHKDHLSAGLLNILPAMSERDWLYSYRQEDVVARVLCRLEERLQNRLPLAEGFGELQRCRKELEGDFHAFMVVAEKYASDWKQNNP